MCECAYGHCGLCALGLRRRQEEIEARLRDKIKGLQSMVLAVGDEPLARKASGFRGD
jgi:hypothetical protein